MKIRLITRLFSMTAIVPIRPPQLKLAAVSFDIPHPEGTAIFVGREWVFKDIDLVCTFFTLPGLSCSKHR